VSSRCVYAGVIEHSIYVHPDTRGRGIAAALLDALIGSTETAGIWAIQSGIFPENTAGLHLHAKAGFRHNRHPSPHRTALRPQWRDVVFIERRSSAVGASQ
jgi:phosphinothricin acetyltransferase